MGKLIRAMDWSKTPLGPVESWPQSLRTTVSLCVASNFPISMAWGPKHIQIYNDGYWPICGGKHPHSMGQDFTECWASAWPAIGQAFERALAGETQYLENQRMFLDRNGYLEETFFTFSFSPIRDETGGVGGLFHPVTETTSTMLSERRTRTLRDLSARTGKAKTLDDAFTFAAQALADEELELPFVLFYSVEGDGKRARLASSTGLPARSRVAPEFVDLSPRLGSSLGSSASIWPIAEVARTGASLQLDDVAARLGATTCGPYPELPKTALVLPITLPGAERSVAVIVAGVSSRLPLTELYRGFYDLVTSTVTAAIANARAYEDERKRAEALAEVDRAKTAFFSNVSHEFRTPLTLILGPVEDALSQARQALEGEKLDMVRRNALRLYKLVNTLLDFSRMEAGRAQATYVATDLSAFTANLASAFESAVESAGLTLVVECAPLPEDVYVDPEMWEKIVLNLLSNAVKYTYQGEIRVRLRWEDAHAVLTVQDTGVGIPEDELPRVFERFYRARVTQGRSHEGTGIGLALVQELVKLHGGSVAVTSKLGEGTRFTVRLLPGSAHLPPERIERTPRQRPSAAGAAPFVEEARRWSSDSPDLKAAREELDGQAGLDAPPELASSRILLVDDNADLRTYVAGLLGRTFANIEIAANGREALALARARLPDLILSDVMMPDLDGFGLVRALRADERTRAIPVILLSARAGDESTVEGLHSGADDYLVKPFSARELMARVRTRLEMDAMRRRSIAHAQAMAALEEQQKWTEKVLNTMPVPLFFMEPGTGCITFANSAADAMAGGSVPKGTPKEAYDTVYRLTDEQDRPVPNADTPGARAARGEDLVAAPVVWHTPAGRFSLLVDSKLLPPLFGHGATVALTVRDVSPLVKAQAELEEAIRVREEFLSIASHELRTPLTPLEVQLHTLERHAPNIAKDEEARMWLEKRIDMLRRQRSRLGRLVDQLLDVSQVDPGAVALELETMNLAEVVKAVLAEIGEQGDFERAGCELRVHADATVAGRWDRFRVEQVLRNLVTNACKFGAGKPITVTVESDGHAALLSVGDQGIGIGSDDRERIFGRFERAVPARHYGGLGLGLYIARQAVLALGGTIRVESAPGAGATFTASLPLRASVS